MNIVDVFLVNAIVDAGVPTFTREAEGDVNPTVVDGSIKAIYAKMAAVHVNFILLFVVV